MSGAPITSHGRGGAGNIAADETPYTDGEIVREGPLGDQGDGPYSTGVGLNTFFVLPAPTSFPPQTSLNLSPLLSFPNIPYLICSATQKSTR